MKKTPPRGDPAVAVAYLRVSLERQADSGLGLEAQRASIERWAATRGITIMAWLEDGGVSGGTPLDKRPGFSEALVALRHHRAGLLVVARRDRLARDVLVAAVAEQLVEREHAQLVSAAGEGEGTEPSANFMRRIIDAAAQYERDMIRARTSSALKAKIARGERLGAARVGEKLVAGRYEPDEAEAALMRDDYSCR